MTSRPIHIELQQHVPSNRFTISDYVDLVDDEDAPLNPRPAPSPSLSPQLSSSAGPLPPARTVPSSSSTAFSSSRDKGLPPPPPPPKQQLYSFSANTSAPQLPPPDYSSQDDPFFSFASSFASPARPAPAPPSSFPAQRSQPRLLISPEPDAPTVTVTSPTPSTPSRPAFFRDRSDRSDKETAPLVTPFPLPPPSDMSSENQHGMRSPEPARPPLRALGSDYLGRGPEPQHSYEGTAEDYVPQLSYPPRPDVVGPYPPGFAAPYQPGLGLEPKDERRLSTSTTGSKRISAVPPPPEKPRSTRNWFSVWLDRFIPQSISCRLLLLVVFLEMLIDIAIQANILWRYTEEAHAGKIDSDDYNARRLPIYLYIFVTAHLVQLCLTVFAIRTRNTIQVIALAIFNGMLLIYAGIEVAEIRTTLDVASVSPDVANAHKLFTLPLNILTGIVIGVIGLAQVVIMILTYFVWREFGWRIYKFLGADLRIRKYYRQYQVFESIVCCSFFFFMSFSIQFLFLILNKKDPEYIVTWVMLPLSFFWLALGLLAAKREWRVAMGVFLLGLLAGMAYFIFKLVRVWQNVALYFELGYDRRHERRLASLTTLTPLSIRGERTVDTVGRLATRAVQGLHVLLPREVDPGTSLMDTVKSYYSVRKSLTVFSALSLVMICLCLGYGVVVWFNFGKGLRQVVDEGRKPRFGKGKGDSFRPVGSNPASPARLTID